MHGSGTFTLASFMGLALAACAAPALVSCAAAAPCPPVVAPSAAAAPSPRVGVATPALQAEPPATPPAAANRPPEPDRPIDEELRAHVIAALSEHLTNDYAFAEMGAELAQAMRERNAQGAYAKLGTASAFARELTRDLRQKDRHLAVFYDPDALSRTVAQAPDKAARREPPRDGAIHRLQVFPGNIGYLQVDGVPELEHARSAIDAAFAFLRQTDALILDCRGNGGGDPHTVAYYLSYLTEGAPFVVNTFHSREGSVEEFWTTDVGRLGYGERKPVWVLTSARTFSGGEELAYDLQALRRAQLVGEVTGGGANPWRPVSVAAGFVAQIPFAHPVNPVTNSNWEGRGVQPDIAVPAAQALDIALAAAQARVSRGEGAVRAASAPLPPRQRPEQLTLALDGAGSGELRGPNLITNGDFAGGLAPWGVFAMQPAGAAPHASSVTGGALCTHIQGSDRVVIGWPEDSHPEAFAIRARVPYRLSFRVSASGRLPLRAVAKIGARMPPYRTVASAALPLDTPPKLLHVDFRSDHDEPRGGIAFEIEAPPSAPDPGSDVCIDDVVLRELAKASS